MTDAEDAPTGQETFQDFAVLVARWLLIEGASNEAADQRVQEMAGSLPEVRSIVGLVNATLKSGCGPGYKRLPVGVQRLFAPSASARFTR